MQSIPLAVLKHSTRDKHEYCYELHAIHTACGIETNRYSRLQYFLCYCMQSIPLAVFFLFSATFFQTTDFFMA